MEKQQPPFGPETDVLKSDVTKLTEEHSSTRRYGNYPPVRLGACCLPPLRTLLL